MTLTMALVIGTVTQALLTVLAAAVAWLLVSTVLLVRRASTTDLFAIGIGDIAIVLAVITLTGGSYSPVRTVLCFGPLLWATFAGRAGLLGLSAGAAVAYAVVAIVDPAPVRTVVPVFVFLAGTTAMGLMVVEYRRRHFRHDRALQNARRALVSEIIDLERRERQRLAADLHDGPLQLVIAAHGDLEHHREGDHEAIANGMHALHGSIVGMRRIVEGLDPIAQGESVLDSLQAVCQRWEQRGAFNAHLVVEVDANGIDDALVVAVATELITNAAKHAAAQNLSVYVRRAPDGLRIAVADDGRGMTPAQREQATLDGHLGLRTIARRVSAVGGTFEITSEAGAGTVVSISVPS
jgi:two-component system NarL family sensor kinase